MWRGQRSILFPTKRLGSRASFWTFQEVRSWSDLSQANSMDETWLLMNSMTMSLRDELEDQPIRVVNGMPGAVATNFGRNHGPLFVNGLLKSVGRRVEFKTGDVLPDWRNDKCRALRL